MTTEGFHRKLTAILSADVQGYSRLMEEDEDSTIRTLTSYRALMSALIVRHEGHVVDTPGDNLLAEFSSVMDAVRCAVEIQEELRIRNADLPENRKMQFRIGINLGDIVEEGDHIYGDGVNIAARVEGLAKGGGICISGTVYDAIRNKLSMSYEFMGEHVVKNIKELVRIYRIRIEPDAATPKAPVVSDVEEGLKTIVVLPFVNISSDTEQEYFVDGLSEEIISSLAQITDLNVTGRTSSFTFKGSNKKVQEIGNELGVENILEGSVRKAGNALRITAQLLRTADGFHLWSKTYKRELKDIFAVQEDIATAVAGELKATLGIGGYIKQVGGTDNEKAYELYLVAQGQCKAGADDAYLMTNGVLLRTNRALESIDAAIALDPKFALAWTYKAYIHNFLTIWGPSNRVATEYDAGLRAAQRAIELEPTLAVGYSSLGSLKRVKGDWVGAGLDYRKAFELKTDPLQLDVNSIAIYYIIVGYFQKAHDLIEAACRNDPFNQIYRGIYILSLGLLGDMQRAEEEYKIGRTLFRDQWYAGDSYITPLRLETGHAVSRDELPYSAPVYDAAKEHLESPETGLAELRRRYTEDTISPSGLMGISVWAAYFGDPEFALDAMEKGTSLEASGLFFIWFPVMREVRMLPRFKEFVREVGLVDYWNEFGWPDICHQMDNGDFECD